MKNQLLKSIRIFCLGILLIVPQLKAIMNGGLSLEEILRLRQQGSTTTTTPQPQQQHGHQGGAQAPQPFAAAAVQQQQAAQWEQQAYAQQQQEQLRRQQEEQQRREQQAREAQHQEELRQQQLQQQRDAAAARAREEQRIREAQQRQAELARQQQAAQWQQQAYAQQQAQQRRSQQYNQAAIPAPTLPTNYFYPTQMFQTAPQTQPFSTQPFPIQVFPPAVSTTTQQLQQAQQIQQQFMQQAATETTVAPTVEAPRYFPPAPVTAPAPAIIPATRPDQLQQIHFAAAAPRQVSSVGLVNGRGICFANAALQIINAVWDDIHTPQCRHAHFGLDGILQQLRHLQQGTFDANNFIQSVCREIRLDQTNDDGAAFLIAYFTHLHRENCSCADRMYNITDNHTPFQQPNANYLANAFLVSHIHDISNNQAETFDVLQNHISVLTIQFPVDGPINNPHDHFNIGQTTFNLRAILVRYGDTSQDGNPNARPGNGHYLALVRAGNHWINYDDAAVTDGTAMFNHISHGQAGCYARMLVYVAAPQQAAAAHAPREFLATDQLPEDDPEEEDPEFLAAIQASLEEQPSTPTEQRPQAASSSATTTTTTKHAPQAETDELARAQAMAAEQAAQLAAMAAEEQDGHAASSSSATTTTTTTTASPTEPAANQQQQTVAKPQQRKCTICFDDVDTLILLSCGHSNSCRGCLQNYCNSNREWLCPTPDCKRRLTEKDVEKIFPGDEQKIEIIRKQIAEDTARELEAMGLGIKVMHCPTPGCKFTYTHDGTLNQLRCPLCHISYCIKCTEPHNADMTCAEAAGRKPVDPATKKALDEFATCRNCKRKIEKTEACNHIHCPCGRQFCYDCENHSNGPDNHAFGCTGYNIGNARPRRTHRIWISILEHLHEMGYSNDRAMELKLSSLTPAQEGQGIPTPGDISDFLASHSEDEIVQMLLNERAPQTAPRGAFGYAQYQHQFPLQPQYAHTPQFPPIGEVFGHPQMQYAHAPQITFIAQPARPDSTRINQRIQQLIGMGFNREAIETLARNILSIGGLERLFETYTNEEIIAMLLQRF